MRIRAFITHKKAETFVDCQDRFGINKNTKSIAVSDGMSQSWQQKIWAQLLVEKFVDDIDWQPNNETIKPLCIQWRDRVVEFIEHLKSSEAPINLVYRNERNLAEGKSAGATFVGIRFCGKEWNGCVLGDSCLIEWNENEATFNTSQKVDSFDNHPDYFDSNILNAGKGSPISICGALDNKTCLLLVSDPFSDFLFEHKKQGDITEYILKLLEISSHDEFESLVDEWRKTGMHNDDTTLVIVESDGSDAFSIDENTLDDINKLIDEEKKLIEENEKEETEQTPAPVSNEVTESEAEQTSAPVPKEVTESEAEQTSEPVSNEVTESEVELTSVPVSNEVTESEAEQTSAPVSNEVTESEAEQTSAPVPNEVTESEAEKTSSPVPNEVTESEAGNDTDAIVEEEIQEEQSEKQIESNRLIITSDNSAKEHEEGEGEKYELVPVEAKAFVDELLAEYKKKSVGLLFPLNYALTEEAVRKAGYAIFKKYNIFNK